MYVCMYVDLEIMTADKHIVAYVLNIILIRLTDKFRSADNGKILNRRIN